MQVCKYASIQIWKYLSLQEYKKGVTRMSQGNFKGMHICCLLVIQEVQILYRKLNFENYNILIDGNWKILSLLLNVMVWTTWQSAGDWRMFSFTFPFSCSIWLKLNSNFKWNFTIEITSWFRKLRFMIIVWNGNSKFKYKIEIGN